MEGEGALSMEAERRDSKLALVLAGGGLTGAVYEIGALRAMEGLLVDRTINDFDIFVGTSAGALVSAFVANGVAPGMMLQALEGTEDVIGGVGRRDIFNVDRREILSRSVGLPGTLATAWFDYLSNRGDATLFDLLWSLADALPAGLHNNLAMERYVRRVLAELDCTNSFRELPRELYIIATELDCGDRVVFGKGTHADVPISLAVAASSALPLVYKPVRVGEKDYVDGGLRGTASLDLAIEQGARLIVCINPLVPFDSRAPADAAQLSDKGGRWIVAQALRIISHSSLHYHIKQLRRTHPHIDVILIEPRPDDEKMFFNNVMRYSARVEIARHGYESVTLDLAEEYERYKRILERHGVRISRRHVIEELARIEASGYHPAVVSEVLRGSAGRRSGNGTPARRLSDTLADLDSTLNDAAGNGPAGPPRPLDY